MRRGALTKLVPIAAGLALAAGCAAGTYDAATMDSGAPNAPSATSDTDGATGTDPPVPAAYYGVSGIVSIASGDVQPKGTSIVLDYWAETELCEVQPAVLDAETTVPPKGTPVRAWWKLTLEEPNPHDTCEYTYATTVFLGFGELDPSMMPPMTAQDLDPSRVYGAYIQDREDTVWVFGYAGTEDNLDGAVAPDREGPLPDGSYIVETLLLLPVQ